MPLIGANQVLHVYLNCGSSVVCQSLKKSESFCFLPQHGVTYNCSNFCSFLDLNKSLANNKSRLKNHLINSN